MGASQASLSFIVSLSLLKSMPIESVMLPNHLILCHPLLLLPSIFSSLRVFSNESALHIRWPKYWSSASVSLSLSKHLGCNFFHFYFPSSIVFHLVFFVHFVNILTSFTVLLSLFVSGKRGSVWLFSTNKSEVFIVHLRRTTGCPQMKHESALAAPASGHCALTWVLDHFNGDTKSFSIKSFLPKENITQKIKCRRKQLT